MDCSSPGPSVHGIFQARVLEWGAIAFSALSDLHICNTVLLTGVVIRYITFLWLTFSFLKITLYFWLCWVFIAGWGLLSSCGVWASHCGGFSHRGPETLGTQAWVASARGLSSYCLQAPETLGTQAWVVSARGLSSYCLQAPETLGTQAWVASARGLSSYCLQAPERRLGSCGAWVLLPRACGIFPDQGLNLSLLNWQSDS